MDTVYTALVFPLLLLMGQTLVALGQRKLNMRMDEGEAKRNQAKADTDAKRKAEAEWRESIDSLMAEHAKALDTVANDKDWWIDWRRQIIERMENQDEKIDAVLKGQTTQMRADITHKIHRYMDDLGCASTEEKDSLSAEYDVYCEICDKHGIQNDFVANLMEQVMKLPSRPNKAT